MAMAVITEAPEGLFCTAGGFHIDPGAPVARAIVTHAHADHAAMGCGEYVCTAETARLLRHRLGDVTTRVLRGQERIGDVSVSLHPAGHVLGSAQVRVEHGGEVWVVSGDYKRAADPTCAPFEPLRCDVFVTEATFALPIFRWDPPAQVIEAIYDWWQVNRARNKASVLHCYALGKAQRILAGLRAHTRERVFVHGAVAAMCALYDGVALLPIESVVEAKEKRSYQGELVLAPVSAQNTPWLKRFGRYENGFASGWMRVRGERRRRNLDRGFVLSDHADWPALLATIAETGAKRVLVTHGYQDELARYLNERGVSAGILHTAFGGEGDA
jgi:putative mRNA 3-end processing factor